MIPIRGRTGGTERDLLPTSQSLASAITPCTSHVVEMLDCHRMSYAHHCARVAYVSSHQLPHWYQLAAARELIPLQRWIESIATFRNFASEVLMLVEPDVTPLVSPQLCVPTASGVAVCSSASGTTPLPERILGLLLACVPIAA